MLRHLGRFFILLLLCFTASLPLSAQCIVVDSAHNYFEDFETGNGNWTPGGTGSDWAWGAPAKAIITGAASGQNCWITGGLTGGSYNGSERSYLLSPCFNFSNLRFPYIEFKAFWEQEFIYDGASLQYSLDNGTSWNPIGGANEQPFCLNQNWFNYAAITNLSGLGNSREGWTGTIRPSQGTCNGGNGSNGWKTASHVMTDLAGKANVRFRFIFGSGSVCNDFDGFALDAIKIGEAPVNVASFTYSCQTNTRVAFTNTSSPCPGQYAWNFGDPASGSANVSALANPVHNFSGPGYYTVTLSVKGFGNAPSTITRGVRVINANASILNPINCNGNNDGAVTVNINTDPLATGINYSWNTIPVSTSQTVTGLGPGTYTITVNADSTCPATSSVTLTAPPKISHTVNAVSGNCTTGGGTASINVTGGTPPYSYAWTPNVSSGSTASSLASGIYTVVVTDSKQCHDTATFQINNIGGFTVAINNVVDVKCFGASTGSATATVNGGTPPFSYSWLPTGGTNATATNLSAGNYKVIVRNAAGCKDSATAQINQPPTGVSISIASTNTSCGQNNGSATATVSGGAAPYTYNWTPGGFTTASITNVAAGLYMITVTDATGCSKSQQVNIGASSQPSINVSATSARCYGTASGSATANVTGGTPPFTYTWTNGTNTYTDNPLQNVLAGTYQLTVIDAAGCIANSSAVISQPAPFSHTVSTTNISCSNPTGSATITETGGTAPYTYTWYPAGGNGPTASNLGAGNFIVTITDANACVDTAQVRIANTSTVSVSISNVKNVSCNGGNNGSATAVATGSGSLSYTWSPTGGNAATAATLAAGSYTVIVKDQTGCGSSASVQITQPPALAITLNTFHTYCGANNGSISTTVVGGTAPYKYNWTPGNYTTADLNNLSPGTYTVTVTDNNGCSKQSMATINPSQPPTINNITVSKPKCFGESTRGANAAVAGGNPPYKFTWTNGTNVYTGNPISNVSSGSYQLIVTDAKRCTDTSTAVISDPLPLSHNTVISASTCGKANGKASIIESGGTAPYTYSWAPSNHSGSAAADLPAGDYFVTIKDANQCLDTTQFTITDLGGLTLGAVVLKNVSCYGGNNGSAAVEVLSGRGPFTYLWTSTGEKDSMAVKLTSGLQKAVVTDVYGCAASTTVTIEQPRGPLKISLGKDTTICPGNELLLSPGHFAHYEWQDLSDTSMFTVTAAGKYSVSVIDAKGCTASASINVKTECNDLVFPDAFTPNNDNLNDAFGPIGTLSAVSNYSFRIYDRWGHLAFQSTDPAKKWNGSINSSAAGTGTYVYVAEYSFNNRPKKVLKGTILLIR